MEDGALNGTGGLGRVSVSPQLSPIFTEAWGRGWGLSLKVKVATSLEFLAQAGN